MVDRPRPSVRDWDPLDATAAPLVSVIVPARNEEAHVERCLRSILGSSYPSFEVIVVDDASTDSTAAIAEGIARGDNRLTVLHGAALPKGWYGKPWACWQGFQAARGNVLLFTDADTVHGPALLGHAVAALETERVDLVTVFPLQELRGFWERVVQPFLFLLLWLRFGGPARLNRNRNPRHAIANGQFLLTTRDAYQWVGGHRKVQQTVVEDLMLAKEYVTAGRRMLFALADQDMTTRMYASLGEIVAGWGKNVFAGMVETTGNRPLAYLATLATLALPLAFLLPAAALGAGLSVNNETLTGFGWASYIGASFVIGHILRASRVSDLHGLFHPLGALATAWILLRAAARGTSRIEWKGRTYSHP